MDSLLKKKVSNNSTTNLLSNSDTKTKMVSKSSYNKMVKTSSTFNCKKYEPNNKQTSPLMSSKSTNKWESDIQGYARNAEA